MSQAAPIESYEPERLGNVWTVKRQASRTSPATGVSAAIWTSEFPTWEEVRDAVKAYLPAAKLRVKEVQPA